MPTLPVSHPGYILATEHNNLSTLNILTKRTICFKGFIFWKVKSERMFVYADH